MRVCNICGHRWKFSKLRYIGEMKYACPDDYQGLTATQISRHNARARPLTVKAVKHPKPDGRIDIYGLEEAQIFNFITRVAPYATQADKDNGAAKSPEAAARAANYLGDLITENLRPLTWIRAAQTTLNTCVAYLRSQQYGDSTGPSPGADATSILYGGIIEGTNLRSSTAIRAGIAFCQSYLTTGSMDSLLAAKRVATFLRHQQCAGQSTSADQTYYGTGVLTINAVGAGSTTSPLLISQYNLADNGAACWFFTLLGSIIGMGTSFGEVSSTYFSGSTVATLQQMTQSCSDFISLGARDTSTGALLVGLSATTPRLAYFPGTFATQVNGAWAAASGPLGANTALLCDQWAECLLGLSKADLLPDQSKAAWKYLMSMSSNVANRTTADESEANILAGIQGTYDPTICPAISVDVQGATGSLLTTPTDSTGTCYDWSAGGRLAPLQSVLDPANYKRAKDTLSVPRRLNAFDITTFYMGPMVYTGLSFQVGIGPVSAAVLNSGADMTGGGLGPSGTATTVNMQLQFKSDVGVSRDGANQVTQWNDQGPNGWNVKNKDVFGATVQGPTFVANKINGLPGLYYSDTGPGSAVGALNYFDSNVAGSIPIATDAPRTIMAIAMRDNFYGGIIFTARQTGTDHEYGLWNNSGAQLYGFVSSTNGALLSDLNHYENQAIVMTWQWHGLSSPTPVTMTINGVGKAWTPSGALQTDTGHSGFSIGNVTSVGASRGFSGWIAEVVMYSGDDPGTLKAVQSYGMNRAGMLTGAYPATVMGAAEVGRYYRYHPGHMPQLRGN